MIRKLKADSAFLICFSAQPVSYKESAIGCVGWKVTCRDAITTVASPCSYSLIDEHSFFKDVQGTTVIICTFLCRDTLSCPFLCQLTSRGVFTTEGGSLLLPPQSPSQKECTWGWTHEVCSQLWWLWLLHFSCMHLRRLLNKKWH